MTDQLTDPNEADEVLEVTLGRRAPFSQLGDWVLFSGVDSDARTLYWGLSAHINTSERSDNEVWPGLAALARILQLKKPENVSKFMLQLEVIGAVEVVRTMVGLVRRNRYVVHQTPPPSHVGARSTSEWYALNRGPKGETAEARKEREAEFDRWLTAVRAALKAHCDKVAKARAAAKKAKAAMPAVELFVAPLLAEFRTPWPGGTARPAETRKAAGQPVPPGQGVRTPWPGGPVPPGQGVERDQHQLDQSLSLVPSGSEHPVDPADATDRDKARETASPEDTPVAAAALSAKKAADVPVDVSVTKPVVDAWAAGLRAAGHPFLPKRAAAIGQEAASLLAAGASLEHLLRLVEWMGRHKPQWNNIENAMTWPAAPKAALPTQRGDVSDRQAAIDACDWCDPYGQLEFDDGKAALCKHDAPPAQGAAPGGDDDLAGASVPAKDGRSLSALFASMRQPAF
ncbi:hypothetical protein ACF1D2_29825 [Streptomyces bacillaris]|uniref:hypothetical protein n=1 Tax=Streptomyces bacillaris TaxID=68179 RepID=UPI0036FC24E7